MSLNETQEHQSFALALLDYLECSALEETQAHQRPSDMVSANLKRVPLASIIRYVTIDFNLKAANPFAYLAYKNEEHHDQRPWQVFIDPTFYICENCAIDPSNGLTANPTPLGLNDKNVGRSKNLVKRIYSIAFLKSKRIWNHDYTNNNGIIDAIDMTCCGVMKDHLSQHYNNPQIVTVKARKINHVNFSLEYDLDEIFNNAENDEGHIGSFPASLLQNVFHKGPQDRGPQKSSEHLRLALYHKHKGMRIMPPQPDIYLCQIELDRLIAAVPHFHDHPYWISVAINLPLILIAASQNVKPITTLRICSLLCMYSERISSLTDPKLKENIPEAIPPGKDADTPNQLHIDTSIEQLKEFVDILNLHKSGSIYDDTNPVFFSKAMIVTHESGGFSISEATKYCNLLIQTDYIRKKIAKRYPRKKFQISRKSFWNYFRQIVEESPYDLENAPSEKNLTDGTLLFRRYGFGSSQDEIILKQPEFDAVIDLPEILERSIMVINLRKSTTMNALLQNFESRGNNDKRVTRIAIINNRGFIRLMCKQDAEEICPSPTLTSHFKNYRCSRQIKFHNIEEVLDLAN